MSQRILSFQRISPTNFSALFLQKFTLKVHTQNCRHFSPISDFEPTIVRADFLLTRETNKPDPPFFRGRGQQTLQILFLSDYFWMTLAPLLGILRVFPGKSEKGKESPRSGEERVQNVLGDLRKPFHFAPVQNTLGGRLLRNPQTLFMLCRGPLFGLTFDRFPRHSQIRNMPGTPAPHRQNKAKISEKEEKLRQFSRAESQFLGAFRRIECHRVFWGAFGLGVLKGTELR